MTTIMVVDDHEVVRMGIKNLLSRNPMLSVVGEAGTLQEALERAATLQPDIIIMDVRLPDGSGVEACHRIHQDYPDIKIIMLTSFPDEDVVIESILAGASGFVLKEIKGNSLVEAVEKVSRGESLLDSTVTGKVLEYMKTSKDKKNKEDDLSQVLTPQELKVLALVAEGKTNKEIGEKMFLSGRTVRNHLSRVMHKLNLSNRAQAAAFYARRHKY